MPPQALPNDGTPRYLQLSSVLAREIGEGKHPVDSMLPPEPELCRRFGVSRHTLREAVRLLCEQGLVLRLQGVGTRVVATSEPQHYVASLGSLQDLMQYTQRTRFKTLHHDWVQADSALARQLRCAHGERWLHIEACRYLIDSELPLVHMHIYVRPEAEPMLGDLDDGSAWVFGLVERYGGERITEANQVVGAVAMPTSSADILGVRAGTPGLLVRRYYLARDQQLLSVSLNYYPAERFELATQWRLRAGPQTL